MDIEKLREKLPNKGHIPKIQEQLKLANKKSFSATYISNVLNAQEQKNGVIAYNQDIIDAAIIVATEYQASISDQVKRINKIK